MRARTHALTHTHIWYRVNHLVASSDQRYNYYRRSFSPCVPESRICIHIHVLLSRTRVGSHTHLPSTHTQRVVRSYVSHISAIVAVPFSNRLVFYYLIYYNLKWLGKICLSQSVSKGKVREIASCDCIYLFIDDFTGWGNENLFRLHTEHFSMVPHVYIVAFVVWDLLNSIFVCKSIKICNQNNWFAYHCIHRCTF